MGLNLPLYCMPQDVYDQIGTEGGQLRQDDHNLASGQTITVTAQTAVNGTTIQVTALQWPLLTGTVLEFDGGGMLDVVQAVLSATAALGASSLTVSPLQPGRNGQPAQVNQGAQAFDSGVNIALAQRLIKACQYGTTQVKLYCCSRYEDSDLQLNAGENGSVNRWATALASRWMCSRRGQPPPKSIMAMAEEALDEMKQVRVGMLQIEDIGTRTAGWPFLSNISLDIGYDYRKMRIETPLSEGTPTQFPQAVDWNSALWVEL